MADAEPSSEREILAREEQQLDFVMSVGIVKECELSMPYRAQLTGDKSNLFLLRVPEFEDILLDFLEEREDVREGIEVNVYDRGAPFAIHLTTSCPSLLLTQRCSKKQQGACAPNKGLCLQFFFFIL